MEVKSMKGISKVLSLVLIMGILCTCLSGCGSKVTAESLLNAPFGKEEVKNGELKFSMVLDMDSDMSEMMGEGSSLNTSIKLNSNIQTNNKISSVDGNIELGIFGMNIKKKLKVYTETTDSEVITYNYDEDNDSWTYSKSENKDSQNLNDLKLTEILKSYELQKLNKGDTVYVVTGIVDIDKVFEVLKSAESDMDALNELSDSFESLEGAVINGTFKFDKESKMLKTFSLNIDTSNATNIENVKINEFSVTLDFVGINNNISVSIPNDVKENAIEETEVDLSGSYDDTYEDEWGMDYDWENEDLENDDWDTNDDNNDELGRFNSENGYFDLSKMSNYFTLNGDTYYLYDNLRTFILNHNLELSEGSDIDKSYIKPHDLEVYMTSDYAMCITASNINNDKDIASNCMVSGISVDFEYLDVKDFEFNGITINSTYDEVIDKFGKPLSEYESEDDGYGVNRNISYDMCNNGVITVTVEFDFRDNTLIEFHISDYNMY